MESNLSSQSSIELPELYVQPHYTESYRLAIYALLCGGREAYEDYIKAEQISSFLSEEEILFILKNAEKPVVDEDSNSVKDIDTLFPSTYCPQKSDSDVPCLELGWMTVNLQNTETAISLLFQPPRQNTPTIKEVVRKQIQVARKVIAIAMDVFTDVDIFKELITAALRGVTIYILLDDLQLSSFLNMSLRVGINIQKIKNICVRTVQGSQYQCQSGRKFHGGLEQKFILLDCQTVLHGTYSYTWSFEKIHRSMVLVITGQLVSSYDEEFRRLYSYSTVPALLSSGGAYLHYPEDTQMLNGRHYSLNNLHMKSRAMRDMRGAQNDSYLLSRGLSVQEQLHQSHFSEAPNLPRGYSYGEELQKSNARIRLKMGARDLRIPAAPEKTGPRLWRDPQQTNGSSHQHLQHQAGNGTYQNLVPFNSETSLHKWKMDTYLKDKAMYQDASGEAASPMISPHSSNTGLNEYQSELIQKRARAVNSKTEEKRQKRTSLQEFTNFRQSHESLRSVYSNVDKTKLKASMRDSDMRLRMMDPNSYNLEDSESMRTEDRMGHMFPDGQRSLSHHNIKTCADQKSLQTLDRMDESLSRTKSDAADLETKPSDSTHHLHSRMMESLTEIPEERELSNTHVNNFNSVLRKKSVEVSKTMKVYSRENSETSSRQDQSRANTGSPPREGHVHDKTRTDPEDLSQSLGSYPSLDGQSDHVERGMMKQEELQKNKHTHSALSADNNQVSIKEKMSIQRRVSLRSENPTRPTQINTDLSQTQRSQLPGISRSQNSLTEPPKTNKHKPSLLKLSQHSSKRKTTPSAEQDHDSRTTLDNEGGTVSPHKREGVHSQHRTSHSNESIHEEKSQRLPGVSGKLKTSSLNRRDESYRTYQAQSGTDNKFGRFIQRMGNLINKNK